MGHFSAAAIRKIDRMERKARECAGLFQRSSACVEGRNVQLSLRHHGMHRLSDRKLKGLMTVIHNYYLVSERKLKYSDITKGYSVIKK